MDENSANSLAFIRQHLHENPELSGHEFQTQSFLVEHLSTNTNAQIRRVAKTGVLAVFESNAPGPSILIRADIDALPIQETNTFSHHSKYKGVSHKCGHDGHTAILLGLADKLQHSELERGNVFLLFQPAEEIGQGAQAVLADFTFKDLHFDFVFALHNLPGFPMHSIVLKDDAFTASVKSVKIKLEGKVSHAAEPEQGLNPGDTVAEILKYATHHTNNNPASDDFFLITPIYVNMGEKAYGISAGNAEVHLTVRCWNQHQMRVKTAALEAFIHKICQRAGLGFNMEWIQEFQTNLNHPEAVEIIRAAAGQLSLKLKEKEVPFKWGEDFGLFTQKYKGALFGLGAGFETPPLHNSDYDFPDQITNTGVSIFYSIIKQIIQH